MTPQQVNYYCHNPHRGGIHLAGLAFAYRELANLREAMENGEVWSSAAALGRIKDIFREVDAIRAMGVPENMKEAYLNASKGA